MKINGMAYRVDRPLHKFSLRLIHCFPSPVSKFWRGMLKNKRSKCNNKKWLFVWINFLNGAEKYFLVHLIIERNYMQLLFGIIWKWFWAAVDRHTETESWYTILFLQCMCPQTHILALLGTNSYFCTHTHQLETWPSDDNHGCLGNSENCCVCGYFSLKFITWKK